MMDVRVVLRSLKAERQKSYSAPDVRPKRKGISDKTRRRAISNAQPPSGRTVVAKTNGDVEDLELNAA